MKRYLHLGCGNNILPTPFENCDVRKIVGIQHNINVYPLKFGDGEFDLLYASHVLEHFKRKDIQDIIYEWVRVLKPGGILRLSVPSFPNLIKIYEISGKLDDILGPLMGGQTYLENIHYMAFDEKELNDLMKAAGLEAIHPWDVRRTIHSDYWDFSQATTKEIPISLNLEGRKKLDGNYLEEHLFSQMKDIITELKTTITKSEIINKINQFL